MNKKNLNRIRIKWNQMILKRAHIRNSGLFEQSTCIGNSHLTEFREPYSLKTKGVKKMVNMS